MHFIRIKCMIELKNIIKNYNSSNITTSVLRGITTSFYDGEFVSIVGKSGSGKSTLLNIIGTLDCPTTGTMILDNIDIRELSDRKLASLRNEKIGFVFQSYYLEPEFTVYENIELPLVISGSLGKKNEDKIKHVLELVDLSNKSKCKAKNLSGGECQRTAIARALINDPTYILADEPCGNLDTVNSKNIIQLFSLLHKMGKTIIMVTHNRDEAVMAQRIITLSDGLIISDEKNTLFN